MPTVVLNLTLKISAFNCPSRKSPLSERVLHSVCAFRREGSSEVGRRRADVGIGPYKFYRSAYEVEGRADRVVRPYSSIGGA